MKGCMHIVWLHLCEAQEKAKLIYGNRNQKVVASGWRVGIYCKGTRKNSWLKEIFTPDILFGWWFHGYTQLSKLIRLNT